MSSFKITNTILHKSILNYYTLISQRVSSQYNIFVFFILKNPTFSRFKYSVLNTPLLHVLSSIFIQENIITINIINLDFVYICLDLYFSLQYSLLLVLNSIFIPDCIITINIIHLDLVFIYLDLYFIFCQNW